MTDWRPDTPFPLYWTDTELATLGWIVATSSSCEMQLRVAVKAVERLDFNQWLRLDSSPAIDLAQRLKREAIKIDGELAEIAERLEAQCLAAFQLRAELVHGLCGEDPETGLPLSLHFRRKSLHSYDALDRAMGLFATLAHDVDAAVKRIADLIIDGVLTEGIGKKGLLMRWRDRDVRF